MKTTITIELEPSKGDLGIVYGDPYATTDAIKEAIDKTFKNISSIFSPSDQSIYDSMGRVIGRWKVECNQ